jgi:hypothetical protein
MGQIIASVKISPTTEVILLEKGIYVTIAKNNQGQMFVEVEDNRNDDV